MPVLSPDIDFLINSGFPAEKLVRLARQAAELAVYPHQHLLATGAIDADTYYRALAAQCGLSFSKRRDIVLDENFSRDEAGHGARAGIVRAGIDGKKIYLSAPYGAAVVQLIARCAASAELRERLVLTTPQALQDLLLRHGTAPLLAHATGLLQRTAPKASAMRSYIPFVTLTVFSALCFVAAFASGIPFIAPVIGSFFAVLYLQAILLRVFALADIVEGPQKSALVLGDAHLPTCSVLVPLYKEGRVVAQLVTALRTLDYPFAKLDILILVEAHDSATQNALRVENLPAFIRVITVPKGAPQTKPRALQLGLSFARGEIITIFDAEDLPHPQQLRHAAAELQAGGAKTACVQAQLKIDNAQKSWLTRHFALEYAALFTVFLPSLTRRGLPVLLGGTSNYFKTSVLRAIGGWDPWNVTEDADLGIRIARAGYALRILETATEEEAPVTLRNWFMQRMRWQKGWMQTLTVHFSTPVSLVEDLGIYKTTMLVATLATSLLSALSYPLVLAALLVSTLTGHGSTLPDALGAGVFGLSIAAFAGGHIIPYFLLFAGAKRAGQKIDVLTFCTVWAYWLLISFAAYGALIGLVRTPFHWNKTEHFGRLPAPLSACPKFQRAARPRFAVRLFPARLSLRNSKRMGVRR